MADGIARASRPQPNTEKRLQSPNHGTATCTSPIDWRRPAPKSAELLIGRAYLEALETMDPSSEYIGRATMEIIERDLIKLRGAGCSSRAVHTAEESALG